MIAASDGVQQLIYFAPADAEQFLRALREKHEFRIAVNEAVTKEGVEWHDDVAGLWARVRFGYSVSGDLWPRLWLQFPPFMPVSVEHVGGRFRGRFVPAGAIEFSTGGLYEKTGEIVSGRIAFTLWLREGGKTTSFRDRSWGYEAMLSAAQALGAHRYKSFLVGPAAWELFKGGAVLIQLSGTKLRLT
jgi:hypothetical protein